MELLERDSPLATLSDLLSEVDAEGGRVALVSGEAGIGKTALIERFAREQRNSVRVLWGACDALFTPRPLGPLHDMTARLGGEWPARLNSGDQPAALFTAFLAELQQHLTLAIFEDVHWADEATLDLLKFLGRRIMRASALVAITYRDDEIGARHPLRALLGDLATSSAVTRIALAPLSEDAVQTLVGERRIDVTALHQRTGGNPFFISEVLESGGSGIPATVRDAVLARANRLSASAQAVLQAAAVGGSRIEPWLLADLAGAEAKASDECLAIGMLVAHGEALAFRHELTRQTVLDSISPLHRATLHRMTLNALKASPTTRQDLSRLAHHAEAAADAEATLEYAPAAARKAAAAGAHREAAALYALALRHATLLPPEARAELLDAYADECNSIDQRSEALAARQKAQALWREMNRPLQLGETLAHTAILYNGLGNTAAASQACDEAIVLLEGQPPSPTLAFAYRIRAGLLMLNQENTQAIEWGERAIALARQFNDSGLVLATQVPLGSAWIQLDYERGRRMLINTIQSAREAGRTMVAAHAYANLSSVSSELHRFDVAEQVTQEGLAYAAEHGQERYRLYMLAWQAVTHLRLGRWEEAVETAGLVLQPSGVSATSRVTALAALGAVRARRGDSIASIVLDEALELLRDMSSLHRVALVAAARAEAAWLGGDHERVADEARAAFDLAARTRHPWFAGELAYWLWRGGAKVNVEDWMAKPYALHIAGDWRAAADEWERLGCPYDQACALADGDYDAQVAALEILDRLGARPAAEALRQQMQASGASVIPRGPRAVTRDNPFGLTNRQLEILTLLAADLTNAEIAARLHLSQKTVGHHVSAVLAKLDVHSREAAAELVRRHPHFQKPG